MLSLRSGRISDVRYFLLGVVSSLLRGLATIAVGIVYTVNHRLLQNELGMHITIERYNFI